MVMNDARPDGSGPLLETRNLEVSEFRILPGLVRIGGHKLQKIRVHSQEDPFWDFWYFRLFGEKCRPTSLFGTFYSRYVV